PSRITLDILDALLRYASYSLVILTIHYFQCYLLFFFFNDTATTEIYTLSLHDALPIFFYTPDLPQYAKVMYDTEHLLVPYAVSRSEEHTSELQSRRDLVCRLLLEKKKICGHQFGLWTCNISIYASMFVDSMIIDLSKKRIPCISWFLCTFMSLSILIYATTTLSRL